MHCFVIQNHHKLYFSKQQTWVNGQDPAQVWHCKFHDEALNTLIELNAKDISLRADVLRTDLNEKKHAVVEVEIDAEVAAEVEAQTEIEAEQKANCNQTSDDLLKQTKT